MINTNITGETMIFKNDKGFYSTSMSKKMVDGTYQSTYIPVQFKKGVGVENETTINITKGFLSFLPTSYTYIRNASICALVNLVSIINTSLDMAPVFVFITSKWYMYL